LCPTVGWDAGCAPQLDGMLVVPHSWMGGWLCRWNSGNACYHSVQNLLSSSLLSKNLKIKIHRSIIMPVLYGCETWSLTLREKRRLRMFENRMLRRIFEPKRNEVTGKWRKLRNEELNFLYSSPKLCG
jgi:hypothetical protein